MKKKTAPAKKTAAQIPNFDAGLVISAPSLVTDTRGVSWWVDPHTQRIAQAK